MTYCVEIQCELPECKTISPSEVIDLGSMFFLLTREQVLSKIRKREYVEARRFMIVYILSITKISLKSVGELFNRDHSTVINARETLKSHLHTEPETRDKWKRFTGYIERCM